MILLRRYVRARRDAARLLSPSAVKRSSAVLTLETEDIMIPWSEAGAGFVSGRAQRVRREMEKRHPRGIFDQEPLELLVLLEALRLFGGRFGLLEELLHLLAAVPRVVAAARADRAAEEQGLDEVLWIRIIHPPDGMT